MPCSVSIHAPLARSNLRAEIAAKDSAQFQYMLLLRGATQFSVFIHAEFRFNTCSSCEEQHVQGSEGDSRRCFNTCSSCEEQRPVLSTARTLNAFQYMLLLRGATIAADPEGPSLDVSIHAPLARSNRSTGRGRTRARMSFNTCSSCEEQHQLRIQRHRLRCFNTCSSCEEQRAA